MRISRNGVSFNYELYEHVSWQDEKNMFEVRLQFDTEI